MRRKEKRNGGFILGFFAIAIVLLLQIAGGGGAFFLGALVVLGLAGSLAWGIKKALRERAGYGYDARGGPDRPWGERYGQSGRTARPEASYRPGSLTAADAQLREDNRRRVEELMDLLEAGIIDRAEYLERKADLEA